MRKLIEVVNKAVFLNLQQGNEVRVIIGGNDGILVTIDANGHIVVTPPEGPGDPEVRQAVSSIIEGVNLLSRAGGVEGRAAGAGAGI